MAKLKALLPSDGDSPPKKDRIYKAGDVIATKYTLIEELGEGGMGVVWVGHNTVLDVPVAVKLMSLGTQADALLRERLLQEARASARIAHSAICRTLDFGIAESGAPFVVMELLRGETLADTLGPNVRIPATRAVQLMLPIINGLGVAHALDIVHRDVKPENVFLSHDEFGRVQPKLLDFGIARFVKFERKLTQEGSLLGTPDYMSPEQARGDVDVDFRTDVWSVAVVLYEMITGKVPFQAENYNKLMWAIQNETPVPSVELAAADAALWTVLERGLEKDRLERWASMHELGEALALWLFEKGVREDACGASLRTTWLEAGLSGVKMEVASVAPPAMPSSSRITLPPAHKSNPVSAVVTKAAADIPFEVGDEEETTTVGEAAAARRRKPAMILMALVATLAVCGFFAVRYMVAQSAKPASAELAPKAPKPSTALTQSPEPAAPAAIPQPTPTVEAQPEETAAPPTAAAPKPAPAPRPKRPAAGKAPAGSKAKQPRAVDFGF